MFVCFFLRLSSVSCIHCYRKKIFMTNAMASHFGRSSTYEKAITCCFWYRVLNDVATFLKQCEGCQKQNNLQTKVKNELHSVPVSQNMMIKIGADLFSLPEANGFLSSLFALTTLSNEPKLNQSRKGCLYNTSIFVFICCHGCCKNPDKRSKSWIPKLGIKGVAFTNKTSTTSH